MSGDDVMDVVEEAVDGGGHTANVQPPDLQTQLEGLLDRVWRCEAEWRFDERIELAARLRATRPCRSMDAAT